MLTRSAKAKGRRLQNQVARDLARVTGLRYGRPDDDSADLRGRPMGMSGPDIVRSERALERVPFYIECRARESWGFGPRTLDSGTSPLVTWFVETANAAFWWNEARPDLNVPLLIVTRNHYPVVAVTGSSHIDRECVRLVLPLPESDRAFCGEQAVCVVLWTRLLQMWYDNALWEAGS